METNTQAQVRCLICDDPLHFGPRCYAEHMRRWVGPDGIDCCPDDGTGHPVIHVPVITVDALA